MVIFDSNFVLHMISQNNAPIFNPHAKETVDHIDVRIDFLIKTLEKNKERIGIPTPVLAEVLVHQGEAAARFLQKISAHGLLKVLPFDQKSAIDLAAMTRCALKTGDKKEGSSEPWQKIKIDRQIVAIAKSCNATCVYTSDDGLARFAQSQGIEVIMPWDLPLPEGESQLSLDLTPSHPCL